MTDVLDLLTTRRSVKPRDMNDAGPSADELNTILTIAARVPDHGKLTPWRFIVFEGEGRRKAGEIFAGVLAAKTPDAEAKDIDKARNALMEAPLVIAVVSSLKSHPKVPHWEQELSAGASTMNLIIAANALGYGANWLTGWFSFDRDVMTALGLNDDERIAGFVHIGRSDNKPEDRPRPALAEIVTRF